MRPGWDDVWLHVAEAVAGRVLCTRARVGAVIVTVDNRVNSASHNGPPAGFNHGERPCTEWCGRAMSGDSSADYSSCPSIHAETNALVRADFTAIRGGTIYITAAICINCAKMVANSGLARVVHIVRDEDRHRDPDFVEEYLRSMGLTVDRVEY